MTSEIAARLGRPRQCRPRTAVLPGAARQGEPRGSTEPSGHVRRFAGAGADPALLLFRSRLPPARGGAGLEPGVADGLPRGADRRRSATPSSTRSATPRSSSCAPPTTRSTPFTTRACIAEPSCAPSQDHVRQFRCPFHGMTWNIDGSLREMPCAWDFPDVDAASFRLPEAQVGTWGGFVFVNLDPAAAPLGEYLQDLPAHFDAWPLEDRYLAAHAVQVLPCNWKVALEAFIEAYHTMAVHPQLLPHGGRFALGVRRLRHPRQPDDHRGRRGERAPRRGGGRRDRARRCSAVVTPTSVPSPD